MSHINLKSIEKILMILIGNLLYSFAIAFFILPSGLITGGTTGNYSLWKAYAPAALLFIQRHTGGSMLILKVFRSTQLFKDIIYDALTDNRMFIHYLIFHMNT